MSKKEKIKITIDVLKTLLLAFLTAIFGVCGYAVINYKSIDIIQFIFIIVGIIFLMVCLYLFVKIIKSNLDEIEKIP